MQKIDRTRRKRRYLVLSFFVPFGVVLLCFILGGLWPFGDRQVLAHDMWHQYYPFFVSFREKLRSGGSLQYLREAGMGIGYLPLYAYYLSSPLYLLSVLVPASLLREFFALLVLTKIGLAGLFFAVFLRTTFRRNEPALVPFSMMYALCSFVAGYYWNIIWLDALALPAADAGGHGQPAARGPLPPCIRWRWHSRCCATTIFRSSAAFLSG